MSPGTAQFLPLLVTPGPARIVSVLTEDVLGAIAEHIGGTGPCSKADLVREMGLPRSTVTGHVDGLLNRGVLTHVVGEHQLKRGRPAEKMGALKTTVAVIDLAGEILARRKVSLPVSQGPEECITALTALIEELGASAAISSGTTVPPSHWVAAIALPARIDLQTRRPLRPTIMPTWDGYPVGEALEEALGCPILLENDCSVRALGEVGQLGPDALPLISIQIGTGVGAGIIDSSGLIIQGANGAAGDVGHIPSSKGGDELCSCGARGCVDAVASVTAMLEKIARAGIVCADDSLEGSERLLSLAAQGGPEVTRVIQESAEVIGEVVASLCNVINPRRVVITSSLATVSHALLAGVRSVVYARARPLATKDLVIDYSQLGDSVGIAGAYLLGRRFLLSSDNIKKLRVHAG
jgi:predicted NBD/HSP70 family sugar kinase